MSKNISFLTGRKGLETNLFDLLGKESQKTGTPSKENLKKLADEFLIGAANTYGSATFYDFMKPENKGKEVYICNGSVCLCAGTQDKLHQELSKHIDVSKIGHMTCLGRCHENSAFNYKGNNYSNLSKAEIKELFTTKFKQKDKYKVASIGSAILTSPTGKNQSYYQLLDKMLSMEPKEVLEEIKSSQLKGRGGAGFPMGIKLDTAANTKAKTKFIICNADEGDPGAYTDRYIMEERPHSLLLGMIIAGYAVGAKWGVLYIRGEYPESVEIIEKAISDLHSEGILPLGSNKHDFSFQFKVIKAQGAYICGEETALISSIEGQRPEVRIRPPFPAVEGLFNMPTIVNNVETLANVPYILKNGGNQFKTIGTSFSTGTKLVSLDSFFNRPGIYEVDMGTPMKTIIDDLGGGFKQTVKAIHIGGPLGGLVPVKKAYEMNLDYETFKNNGFLLGHASFVSIPQEFPLVKYLQHLFEFTSFESCGKCFPCRLGSKRGSEMLEKSMNSDYKIDRELFNDLLDTLEQGSLCALGGGLPLPVRNALQYFDSELSQYFEAKVNY
jgi:NADH:ubiquinone oxidoreductase subunit F (NADH-binding)/NADH:ubiquinone oxidoreductase subunit E